MNQRYKYTYYDSIPDELNLVPEQSSDEYEDWKNLTHSNCSSSRTNPNHHFNYQKNMRSDDNLLQICEVKDTWNKDNTKIWVIREIHSSSNHRLVEFSELWLCYDCGVWCKGRNNIKLPWSIWNHLDKANSIKPMLSELSI